MRKNPEKKVNRADELWMLRALSLAEKGRFSVSPNPMVGACLVKNGKLVGEGFHCVYGGPHAEAEALKSAGNKARGAVLYVTLEPCVTYGKTPPCSQAVIEAGIRKVIVGSLDPNPRHTGKGVQALRRAGLEVISGVLSEEVKKQNESFFKFMKTGRPFVTLKMAQSLDGKIATHTGHARWISGKTAREFVHRLRAEQDAVLVGTNTLKQDDPLLSPRVKTAAGREAKPWRIVLDPRFEISPKARVFSGKQLTILAVSDKIASRAAASKKKIKSAVILPVRENKGRLDLDDLLRKLGGLGVSKLLVEGGGELAWSLIQSGLVDKFYWIVAPKFIGGRSAKTSAEGDGVSLAPEALPLEIVNQSRLGEDFLFEARLQR